MWGPAEGLRRRHVDWERVEGTPQEEVQSVGLRVRALLSGRPARVAEGQRPDGARAGALEALDGGRGRTLGRRAGRVPQEIYGEKNGDTPEQPPT